MTDRQTDGQTDRQTDARGKTICLPTLKGGDITTLKACYGKCSKILNAFLFLFSNKMLVFMAGIHKMLVRIANMEDPDQTV